MGNYKIIKSISKSRNFYFILAFLISFLPRAFMALKMIPLRTLSDELSTLASAALLADLNWKFVISEAGYYGFGFYWIFFPLFRFLNDPVLIYRIILLGCSFTQALSSCIAYYIAGRFFEIIDPRVKMLIAVISSYMVVTRATITYNEHALILLTWLIVLLLCFILENAVKKTTINNFKYLLFLILLFLYSLTIHTRALIYFLSFFSVCILFYALLKKTISLKWIPVFAAGYFLVDHAIAAVQDQVWSKSKEDLRNASLYLKVKHDYFDLDTWVGILDIWVGQLTTITIASCGLFTISIIIMAVLIYKYIKKKDIGQKNTIAIVIMSYLFLCICATIFAQSLSWLNEIVLGIKNHIIDSSYYSYKAITYVRYFGPYIGPFIMITLIIMYHNYELFFKNKVFYVAFAVFTKWYWFFNILPLIQNNEVTAEVFYAFSIHKIGDKMNIYVYLCGFFALFILVSGSLFCNNFNKFKIILYLTLFLLIHQYCYTAYFQDLEKAKRNYSTIDKTMDFIKVNINLLQNENINEIYVYDSRGIKDRETYYLFQFYLKEYKIIPTLPKSYDNNTIVLCVNQEDEISSDLICLKLDEKEYIYMNKNLLEKMVR